QQQPLDRAGRDGPIQAGRLREGPAGDPGAHPGGRRTASQVDSVGAPSRRASPASGRSLRVGHLRDARGLTLEAAKAMAAAAERFATERSWTIAVAVVDASGGLILFHCLEDTQPGSQDA